VQVGALQKLVVHGLYLDKQPTAGVALTRLSQQGVQAALGADFFSGPHVAVDGEDGAQHRKLRVDELPAGPVPQLALRGGVQLQR
jgi:hypothetical protein